MGSFSSAKRALVAIAIAVVVSLLASACRSEPETPVTGVGDDTNAMGERQDASRPEDSVSGGSTPGDGQPDRVTPVPAVSMPLAPERGMSVDPTPDQGVPSTNQTEPAATPTPAPAPTPTALPTPDEPTMTELLAMSSLEPVRCPADVQAAQVACSLARVPESSSNPDPGKMVDLMIARVDNGDPHGVGPVVFLQGGPGVGSVTSAPDFVGASHDLILVDQRGTGYSAPKLNCPEVDALWAAQFTDDPAVRATAEEAPLEAAYADCATRLIAEGIDLEEFNTTAAAVDFELLRRLLGYDRWSLWGISYGTRLGLTIMRDHPDGVRAAVLDSVLPFEVDFFASIPGNGLRSMTALDEACEAERCLLDHGDFLDNLSALVKRLDAEPVVVTATRPVTGESFPFRVDGEQLISMVFTQLYSTRSLRSLPRQVARADFGGLDEMVANFLLRRDPNRFDLSLGLYYTTWCREEIPFFDEAADDAALADAESYFGPAFNAALSSEGIDAYCDFFAVEAAAPSEDEPLSSDIPTLVFAGAFDPITPPEWSRQVAMRLPNSFYVELPDHGHGMATSCPVSVRLAFLIDPLTQPDTACVDATAAPDLD